MSRFKERRRIEQAIAHNNKDEIAWALNYCKMRLSISKLKTHKKHWQNQIRELQSIIK